MGKRDRAKNAQKTGKGKGGRPRKAGERYPSGKLKPQADRHAENVVGSSAVSPTIVHRIRELGRAFGQDPRLGSELGRLLLLEQITTFEAAAGFRLADIYRRFERQHGPTRRSAKSPSYELGFGGSGGEDEGSIEAREQFVALQEKWKVFPHRARDAVEALCIDDRPIGPAALFETKTILAWLGREHFKMHAAVIPTTANKPGAKVGRRAARTIATEVKTLSKQGRDPSEVLAGLLRDVMPRDDVLEVLKFARALRDRERVRADREVKPAQ